MATFHTPPIDLYAESTEGFREEHRASEDKPDPWHTQPAYNGDRDEPAIDAGSDRLDQVLGW